MIEDVSELKDDEEVLITGKLLKEHRDVCRKEGALKLLNEVKVQMESEHPALTFSATWDWLLDKEKKLKEGV
jgi:hypothetical protein